MFTIVAQSDMLMSLICLSCVEIVVVNLFIQKINLIQQFWVICCGVKVYRKESIVLCYIYPQAFLI